MGLMILNSILATYSTEDCRSLEEEMMTSQSSGKNKYKM
jgi:hypothetical protein